MKLRNKKTGEKVDLLEIVRLNDISDEFYLRLFDNEGRTFKVGFNSLTELNDGWEDYEEPKEYYCIDWTEPSGIYKTNCIDERDDFNKEIGNYFSSREEAEKAVEKLKAAKRLKDKGIRFEGWDNTDHSTIHNFSLFVVIEDLENINKDLDLLFGGEDDKN